MQKLNRNKFSVSDKLQIVKFHLEDGYSFSAIANELSTCKRFVSLLVNSYQRYGESGLSLRNHIDYGLEFKLDLLQNILRNKLSLHQASLEYLISPSVIHNWQVRYEKYGVSGLERKRNGRPPKNKLDGNVWQCFIG
jgi:transposase